MTAGSKASKLWPYYLLFFFLFIYFIAHSAPLNLLKKVLGAFNILITKSNILSFLSLKN